MIYWVIIRLEDSDNAFLEKAAPCACVDQIDPLLCSTSDIFSSSASWRFKSSDSSGMFVLDCYIRMHVPLDNLKTKPSL